MSTEQIKARSYMCSYCCYSSLLRRHFVLFILSRHLSLSFLIFLLLLQLFLLVHFPCLHIIHPSIVYLTCFFSFTFRFILFLPSLPSSTLFHLLLSSPAVMLSFRLLSSLTLILLTWRIWWSPNKASKGQMGFNSAFKGLNSLWLLPILILLHICFFLLQ